MRRLTAAKHLAGQRGFSLLELLVAFAIMAMSLGLLYRAAGGSVRSVGEAERHEYAVAFAESLMASYDVVPAMGISASGEFEGLSWEMSSQLHPTSSKGPEVPVLHLVSVKVTWGEASQPRQVELVTLLPEQIPLPGGVLR
ncbi:MAG: type IV pilus modification PilV family protein [Burkholderiaceae bacterium]